MLRRWFNTPIIVWECDWMPRELKKVPKKNSTYSAFPRKLSSVCVCVQVCLDCWYVHHRYLCLWKTNVCFFLIKKKNQTWSAKMKMTKSFSATYAKLWLWRHSQLHVLITSGRGNQAESQLKDSSELTYPTLGKGKSSSNMIFHGIC